MFWQICSGVDENAVGACSELVFAPIDEMFPDDAPLLPSGFRIIPLDSKTVKFCCPFIVLYLLHAKILGPIDLNYLYAIAQTFGSRFDI